MNREKWAGRYQIASLVVNVIMCICSLLSLWHCRSEANKAKEAARHAQEARLAVEKRLP